MSVSLSLSSFLYLTKLTNSQGHSLFSSFVFLLAQINKFTIAFGFSLGLGLGTRLITTFFMELFVLPRCLHSFLLALGNAQCR